MDNYDQIRRVIDPLSEDAKQYSNAELDFINYQQDPDPDFNYQRNQQIIEETIEKNRKIYELKRKINREALGERYDMAVDYLRHLDKKRQVAGEDSAERYFGRATMAKLYGEKLMEKLKQAKRQNEQLGKVLI